MNADTTLLNVQDLTPEEAATITGSGGFYDFAVACATLTATIVVDAAMRLIG